MFEPLFLCLFFPSIIQALIYHQLKNDAVLLQLLKNAFIDDTSDQLININGSSQITFKANKHCRDKLKLS